MLTPEWEKLAKNMKNIVKIAYWDTTQQAPTPRIIGQISGTPTIKLIKPKLKKNKKNKKKIVMDNQYERKAKALKQFVSNNINSFVEKIDASKGLQKFQDKGEKYGLPLVLVFTKSATTKPLVKYASAEFRRRLLLGEIKLTKRNKEIIDKYGVKADETTLIVVPRNSDDNSLGEPVRYPHKKFSFHKVINFLSKHALKKAVEGALKKKTEEKNNEPKKDL